jgi:hypothetical protein
MTTPLNPGDRTTEFTDLDGSLADLIDHELDTLLKLDSQPGLSFDTGNDEVRARRRLFVAIARGVLLYLARNPDALDITVPTLGTTVHPVIHVTGA